MGLRNLDTPLQKKVTDEEAKILQDHGIEHEKAYVAQLQAAGKTVTEIAGNNPHAERLQKTEKAMRSGADVVYQAAFESGSFRGYADFLLRVETPSELGAFSYEVTDTKLARHGKARHLVQIALYSDMLKTSQEMAPQYAHLELGDNSTKSYRLDDYRHYVGALKQRFVAFTQEKPLTTPEKCGHCGLCCWEDICKAEWLSVDHLNQVANIRASDIRKLCMAGINTLSGLANSTQPVVGIGAFATLQAQAKLQLEKRTTGKDIIKLKQPDPIANNGFYQLPVPDTGDLYFDMEGYPHEKDGLEYLFGVCFREGSELKFKPFWGHDRVGEKMAFQAFIDFVIGRIKKNPQLHIYHYADYERRALKKLMQMHGTREAEVDQILRDHRLVDLYAVVRHALMTSEPRYSIKNLETFYMKGERQSDVKNAGASIIYYESWRKDKSQEWLDDIERYNEEDCISTEKLHNWLLEQRDKVENQFNVTIPWKSLADSEDVVNAEARKRSPESLAAEERKTTLRTKMLAYVNANPDLDPQKKRAVELMLHLLEFYWRELKPSFWKMFEQQEKSHGELIDDLDAIGGLTLDRDCLIRKDKHSLIFTYRLPLQEFRLKAGDGVRDTGTLKSVGSIDAINTANGTLTLRIGESSLKQKWDGQLPDVLSIASSDRVNTGVLEAAVLRLASSRFGELPTSGYEAIWNLLERQWPAIDGIVPGQNLIDGDATPGLVSTVVQAMRNSYLVIQGPPGTGKTYTGARVILDLLQKGKRVGVCAISHKAIANLLNAVTLAAIEVGQKFKGARKGDKDSALDDNRFIVDIDKPEDTLDLTYRLVGGTAWVFARKGADQTYDYLFVDEAGQVSLANLVAMGCSAKNIVLLGDQMQLGQPLQGTHPGESGLSALQYLLRSHQTVPPELGILLNVSRRMHPDICRFISEAVYEGRLTHHADTEKQHLILCEGFDPALKRAGIVFCPVRHDGCSQTSRPEAEKIRDLIKSLRGHSFVDSKSIKQTVQASNILVVAPYNAQVGLLREVLPADIAVGTVDKFQGQEAEVVIVSMTTSGSEEMPRNMEFLFDRNRLNVAISRAKTLAIVVASPGLLEINCSTPEQMALVNTLCWVASWQGLEA